MSKYIKELLALDAHVQKDKKFLKKIFEDKSKYYLFVRDNLAWMLEKCKYDFLKEEVAGLLHFIARNSKNIVQENKDIPYKFNDLLQPFIEHQSKIFPDLNLKDYADTFTKLMVPRQPKKSLDNNNPENINNTVSAYQRKEQ